MKKFPLIFCLLIFTGRQYSAQADMPAKRQQRYFLSMGTHLNMWAHVGVYGMPANFQAEYLVHERHGLAAAYSFEEYKEAPFFFLYDPNLGDHRHNIRLRYSYYYRGSQKIFSQYIGCSLGASYWYYDHPHSAAILLPTSQFFYGMRVQPLTHFFANLEFATGAPYMIRFALGAGF